MKTFTILFMGFALGVMTCLIVSQIPTTPKPQVEVTTGIYESSLEVNKKIAEFCYKSAEDKRKTEDVTGAKIICDFNKSVADSRIEIFKILSSN